MNSEIQTLIANVGFPIAISMYLLIRIESKLSALSDSINELSKNINVMSIKWKIMDVILINTNYNYSFLKRTGPPTCSFFYP